MRFKNRSQAGQDYFAFEICGTDGTYLEVGANHPRTKSNTYNLEVEAGWKGISIELDTRFQQPWNEFVERKNKIYFASALGFDYTQALKDNDLPMHLNYLSCDIEPAENTFQALKEIIEAGVSFDCITFEDDRYSNGLNYDVQATEFLNAFGYKVAVTDVYHKYPERKFETWFVKNTIPFDHRPFDRWIRRK